METSPIPYDFTTNLTLVMSPKLYDMLSDKLIGWYGIGYCDIIKDKR